MDKLEYIPGDLVMTNGVPLGTKEGVVYRVTSSDPSRTLKLGDRTIRKGIVCLENIEGVEIGDKGYLSGDTGAWVKDIIPIPLSTKILLDNGWIRDKGYPFAYTKGDSKGIYTIIESIREPVIFTVCCGIKNYVLRDVRYVHQLQHLLFGLGLNHEMKV